MTSPADNTLYSHVTLEQMEDAKLALRVMDLTNLDEHAQEHQIMYLSEVALKYKVAAVCIYPKFISLTKTIITTPEIKIATVANFPKGEGSLDSVKREIESALALGADEIDVVFPYQKYLLGDQKPALQLVEHCKKMCAEKTLKVILETGAFNDSDKILHASREVIEAGADFIKTSTGKINQGATLLAAVMMLSAIKEAQEQGKEIGLKISGGVRTLDQVRTYFALSRELINDSFIDPQSFRIGASSLLDDLIPYLSGFTSNN